MSDTETATYPHVREWQRPLVEQYGRLFNNTGGNDPLGLLNDLQNPGTDDRPNRLASVNVVRFTLAVAVQTQVNLLHRLVEEGLLTTHANPANEKASQ